MFVFLAYVVSEPSLFYMQSRVCRFPVRGRRRIDNTRQFGLHECSSDGTALHALKHGPMPCDRSRYVHRIGKYTHHRSPRTKHTQDGACSWTWPASPPAAVQTVYGDRAMPPPQKTGFGPVDAVVAASDPYRNICCTASDVECWPICSILRNIDSESVAQRLAVVKPYGVGNGVASQTAAQARCPGDLGAEEGDRWGAEVPLIQSQVAANGRFILTSQRVIRNKALHSLTVAMNRMEELVENQG